MYGDDDRVITLLNELNMSDRLIPFNFDQNYNYMEKVVYDRKYLDNLEMLKNKSLNYIDKYIIGMWKKYERD